MTDTVKIGVDWLSGRPRYPCFLEREGGKDIMVTLIGGGTFVVPVEEVIAAMRPEWAVEARVVGLRKWFDGAHEAVERSVAQAVHNEVLRRRFPGHKAEYS